MWSSTVEKDSARKVPATVRASDMNMYHQRCGTAMMQKNPLEYESRLMNQSLDFDHAPRRDD